MSGGSRRGRKKPPNRRPIRHLTLVPDLDEPPELELPGVGGLTREIVRGFRDIAYSSDPLDAELFTSQLMGAWWRALPQGEDPEEVIGQQLVEYAARRGSRESLAMCGAFAALGTGVALRERAAVTAEQLSVTEPIWGDDIGRVATGDCWAISDIFGEMTSLLCEFAYGSSRHALIALLDRIEGSGFVKDVFLTDDPDGALAEYRDKVASIGETAVLEKLEPAVARSMLQDGLAATDMLWEPPESEELRNHRAVALAMVRAMPSGAALERPDLTEAERETIVAQFLASAAGLPAEAAYCARLIADFHCDYGTGDPLEIGPARIETFLRGWLPRKVILDEDTKAAMPAVTAAWVDWAARQRGLPDSAIAAIVDVAEDCGASFADDYEDPVNRSIGRDFLEGLDLENDV